MTAVLTLVAATAEPRYSSIRPGQRWQDTDIPTRRDVGPQAMTEDIDTIIAPFQIPQLARPVITSSKVIVKLNKRGMNTKAIQAAIDRQARRGGGEAGTLDTLYARLPPCPHQSCRGRELQ